MNINFFDKLYFGYVKKQISVGNRSDPMSISVAFLSFTFALNAFAIWVYILLLLPRQTTENIFSIKAIVCSMALVFMLVLCYLVVKKRYKKIVVEIDTNYSAKSHRIYLAFAWSHLICTFLLIALNFYLFYLKNNGRL